MLMVDLLLITPHPDDEVFGCGGLFSKMAAFGKRAATLTLTRGGAGRSLGLCEQCDLPDVREAELRVSLDALGVRDVHIWDYPDFLPDGNRGMEHREGLRDVAPGKIVPRIASLLDELKPEVLVTFQPNGSNGHPDHVMTNEFVLAALKQAAHQPKRIYYYAGDKPYDADARAGFLAPEKIAAAHLYPTHYVEVGNFIEPKLRAMGAHKTQALSVMNFMHRITRRLLIEGFHRVYPEVPKGEAARTVMWL